MYRMSQITYPILNWGLIDQYMSLGSTNDIRNWFNGTNPPNVNIEMSLNIDGDTALLLMSNLQKVSN